MEYVKHGNSDLNVSRICLGCMGFGDASIEIKNGINGRQHVMNSIDSSLQHLGMDYVDLYIYHIWDYTCAERKTGMDF